jgi:hypothetical protein
LSIPYHFKKGREEALYEIDDVPVLPLDEIEQIVLTEALRWYHWLVLKELPPVVTKEQSWLCKSCAFNGDLIKGERCHPNQEREVDASQLELV